MNITELILSKVEHSAQAYSLWSKGDHILIALSGGADSVALTEIMLLLSKKYSFTLCCAHLNHMFRGEEANRDEQFCRTFAAKHNLPFFSRRIDLPALCKDRKGSSQMVARQVRYDFLKEMAAHNNCSLIALGHNRDDRVETLLMKIFSGSSPAGIASIPCKRNNFVRPIIDITRSELEKFLQEHNIDYVEDSSNAGEAYRRNQVRHRLIPLLGEMFPGFEGHLTDLMQVAGQENLAWEQLLSVLLGDAVVYNEHSISVEFAVLYKIPNAALNRLLAKFSLQFSNGERIPEKDFFMRSKELLESVTGSRIWFKNKNFAIYEDGQRLTIEDSVTFSEKGQYLPFYEECTPPARVELPFAVVEFSIATPDSMDRNFFQEELKKGIFWLNVDFVDFPLVVRNRRDGDRIVLSGTGTKKIKDLLIDGAVPRNMRDKCLVIENRSLIFGCIVPEMLQKSRVSQQALVREQKQCLRLKVESI